MYRAPHAAAEKSPLQRMQCGTYRLKSRVGRSIALHHTRCSGAEPAPWAALGGKHTCHICFGVPSNRRPHPRANSVSPARQAHTLSNHIPVRWQPCWCKTSGRKTNESTYEQAGKQPPAVHLRAPSGRPQARARRGPLERRSGPCASAPIAHKAQNALGNRQEGTLQG